MGHPFDCQHRHQQEEPVDFTGHETILAILKKDD